MYVANQLQDKEECEKLLFKSLQLFVQQGIDAKKGSDRADATHKVWGGGMGWRRVREGWGMEEGGMVEGKVRWEREGGREG